METYHGILGHKRTKDQDVLNFVEEFWMEKNSAPTLMEIARGLGLEPAAHYKSAIFYCCQRLVRAGKLEEVYVPFGTRRSYQVVTDAGEQ